jgi:hypothetical protein
MTVSLLLDSEVVRKVYEAQYIPEEILKMRRNGGVIEGKKVTVREGEHLDPATKRLQRAAIRLGKVHSVVAKKVKHLSVKLTHNVPQPDGDLVSQCYMAVDAFEKPATSSLPLTIVAPSHEAFVALLNNFELLTFLIEVDYHDPHEIEVGFGNMTAKSVVRKERSNSATSEGSPLLNPFHGL